MERCPCGRERPYDECCGPYVRGEAIPETAEDLMRSRYTAYAKEEVEYLLETHDPARLTSKDKGAIARAAASTKWHELKVLRTEGGGPNDEHGKVLFEAKYTVNGRPAALRELSVFRRIEGRWFYVTDEKETGQTVKREGPKTGRNEPCPCGSGKKYKQCHGR
jgi:SEC-C motif-containing protein